MKVVRTDHTESPESLSNSQAVGEHTLEFVFGHTAAMQDVKRKVESAANTDLPVLLQGESGTGKNLCAQIIHQASTRSGNALIKVNCPAIPPSLLDTELFGYDKGAFAGARQSKPGRVEQAHRSTLVLDEVSSLDGFAQSKLLQVLQDGTFTRAGGRDLHPISTRLVSLANTNLREKTQEGTFSVDLLYRINSVTINLPPLRERLEDLPELIACFSARHASTFRMQRRPLSKAVVNLMQEYPWPGNLRELDNLVRSYILLGNEDVVASELVWSVATGNRPQPHVDTKQPFSLKRITKKATQELERQIILKVLQANGWNRQRTAKWLQISYRSLLYKLNEVEQLQNHSSAATGERVLEPSPLQPIPPPPGAYPLQVQ